MRIFLRKKGKPVGDSFSEAPCYGAEKEVFFSIDNKGHRVVDVCWYKNYNNIQDFFNLSKELNCEVTLDNFSSYNGSYVVTLGKTRNK